jgi:hypothetical protein
MRLLGAEYAAKRSKLPFGVEGHPGIALDCWRSCSCSEAKA